MKVAVSGATGFIGRHVVAALARAGHEVIAVVRAKPATGGVPCHVHDFAERGELDPLVSQIDAFVHGAAHVPRSHTDPGEAPACLAVNALGTLDVLGACANHGRKLVVISGANIYRFRNEPVTEDAPIDPSARAPYYLASKACADFYACHFHREGLANVAILRPSAVYGPGLERGAIPAFAARLRRGEPIVVNDGGRYHADFVYVEDVATAVVRAVTSRATGPFNLGAGVSSTMLDVARGLIRAVGAREELLRIEPAEGTDPVGYPPLDITRARTVLGFVPKRLDEGLATYVRSLEAT